MLKHINLLSWITILAIVAGPIVAVQIETLRKTINRKYEIFKTLMSNRSGFTRLNYERIKALNTIDTEFIGCRKIMEAWKTYRKHMHKCPPLPEANQETKEYDQKKLEEYTKQLNEWTKEGDDMFAMILFYMSKYFYNKWYKKILFWKEYNFTLDDFKDGSYTPQAYAEIENDNFLLRKRLLDVLHGKQNLFVKNAFSDEEISKQKDFLEKINKVLMGEQPIAIKNSKNMENYN